ncbi:hypothetical protein BMF94_6877 [Rhodotorula taiwanensis]|uniref:COQ9 C-terminal domain-containing protein n=1 Tax=Rhodotorula taiwanensis TaxID=741276 RepID=A0A2S5AZZ5_9BASI|nr:hypothetical protein BMF94_6877 [Rhodotorula taiwanensis]
MSSLPRQLARAALPHVAQHGFTTEAFLAAAASTSASTAPLPPTLPKPLSPRTLHALYPSPPAREPFSFSLKGLALGNGGKRSLSKRELIQLARGQGTALARGERTGPARALVNEWLIQGRERMVDEVRASGLRGVEAYKRGIEARLRYNQDMLDRLPSALALLSAPTSTYLSDLSAALPVPHITPHLAHVAEIAHDLAKAGGSQHQGTEWYSLRLRLGTIYALSELSLVAPPSSPTVAATPALPAADRIQQAIAYSHRLFDQTGRVGQELDNVGMFAEWVRKSWMGIGRSLAA